MANAKDKHYWKQLRETLTAGRWDHSFPAKTPNGAPLSWSELIRKFNKHCIGQTSVSELASQLQALSLLISANSSDRSLDANEISSHGPLALGQECILPEERMEEALAGYNALKKQQTSNSDSISLAIAYYAYALRRPAECLSALEEVKSLPDTQSRVSTSDAPTTNSLSLRVPSVGGSVSSTLIASNASAVSCASVAEISDGSTWSVVESARSICLRGMCHETMSPNEPQKAFDTYMTALPLIASIIADIPPYVPTQPTGVPTNGVGTTDASSFGRYRELWRWVERLLRRAIIIGSRLCDIRQEEMGKGTLWRMLDSYHSCSAHWPPTFRSEHRSTIAVLHLRAFVLRVNPHPATSSPPVTRENGGKPNRWISAARSVVQEYRAILSVSTQFPKAGQRNVKVEDLADLCVAIWEADGAVGEYAGWVIDVLWWATRLTFNSCKVYRHMTRLLYVSGDSALAKRTLRLYVQVVSKARETKVAAAQGGSVPEDDDIDADRSWVETLVQGARMLCRLALAQSDGGLARDDAAEAGVLIEKAKTRLNKDNRQLVGSVELAEGIWQSVMAYAEQEPRTRPTRFADSLALLKTAAETYPTPSVHYHLALAYARPGLLLDIQEAISHARLAVEAEPGEIRYWHLLGLLLTASGDWRAAQGVLEVGAGVGEVDLADDATVTPGTTQANGFDGVQVHDYASRPPSAGADGAANGHAVNGEADTSSLEPSASSEPVTLLDSTALAIPPSASLLRPIPDRPPPSRHEAFEQALQLRMTQLTLAEYVEGPEGAGDRWVEVFHWFSERREIGIEDRRLSIDSRRDLAPLSPLSEAASTEKPRHSTSDGQRTMPRIFSPVNAVVDDIPPPPTPIPIKITPASPAIISSPGGHTDEESPTEKRSSSLDDPHRDLSKGKKVKEVLKDRVHKGQAGITRISKKIGHNVGRHGSLNIKRSNSTPDLHAVLSHSPYQASSIHLRQHLSIHASHQDLSSLDATPPPPPPAPPLSSQFPAPTRRSQGARAAQDQRMLSNLWLMSAAMFRRLGKIEQARAAVQEAEVKDENNPAVWVQLGLYHMALNHEPRAMEAFQKALFISADDVAATIHLCRLYLSPSSSKRTDGKQSDADRDNIDLAVGLLSDLTRGRGWDVPEAWYFLAKHHGLQGRKGRERECLSFALTLSETRTLRDIGQAVGWCL
ncbi:hypothetical protein WOLCODRAFT_139578 [Wolfiporia cocos MD-104 SS10]|uniref:TPR-like protein n=1 Tax=Wolfiporia cocos (strain MD-104) TaxID=742152 RepID=A0A2H3IXS0_WOLCO|nr:hypothetical protein WOLCODRAFT_139578 [Wolfiporia cocos MD-104 SS10]